MIETARLLLEPLARALRNHPYLAGDELSLADLFVLPMVIFANRAIPDARLFTALPDLAQWYGRLARRRSVTSTEG